jgi:long-chain acyl-CoA synthetase
VAVARAGLEDEVAVMLHTSGTTSNSKRVMLTHSNLINNVESNIQSLALTEKDKVLIAMPMYFGYCNTAQFLTHLYLGATMVLHDSVKYCSQNPSTLR